MGWGGKFPVTAPWITRLHRFPDCCSDVMKEGERNFPIPASLPSSDRGSTETEEHSQPPFCTNLPIQHQR